MSSAGIFPITGGKFEVKAGQHVFKGGEKASNQLPKLPKLVYAEPPYSARFQLFKSNGRNFEGYKYFIKDTKGNMLKEGILDDQGFTEQVVTEKSIKIEAYKSVMRESERITENWESKLDMMSKRTGED